MHLLVMFLVLLLIISCALPELIKDKKATAVDDDASQKALTDEELLQKYPDTLDEALQEVEMLE